MLGSILVFAAAVLIVAVYMTIVHSFLRSAEEPADVAPRASQRAAKPAKEEHHPVRAQLAH